MGVRKPLFFFLFHLQCLLFCSDSYTFCNDLLKTQVESIVLSIISMLSSPNDESPANIEAAVSSNNTLYYYVLFYGLCFFISRLIVCCAFSSLIGQVPCPFGKIVNLNVPVSVYVTGCLQDTYQEYLISTL